MLQEELFRLEDPAYKSFQSRLIPNISPERIIGIRIPALRRLAKRYAGSAEAAAFLKELPHRYYDEDMLHALLLSEMKDTGALFPALEAFLPYVDNWAVCDSLRPGCLRREKDLLLERIPGYLDHSHPYTRRFGLEMLMVHFLEEDFSPQYLCWAARTRGGEYYVDMMLAWYFATALAKQPDAALVYLQEDKLPVWVHNKTIQKARESYRLPDARKQYLATLRR